MAYLFFFIIISSNEFKIKIPDFNVSISFTSQIAILDDKTTTSCLKAILFT